jgi:anti-sigma B factor antagonist
MAALNIIERRAGSATLLALSGHLVADEGDRAFTARVSMLVDAGRLNILVDLRGITYVDSGGVGALVAMYMTVLRRGGRLKLLRPSPRVWRVLRMTHLTNVFEIFEREEEALCSFGPLPIAIPADADAVAAR